MLHRSAVVYVNRRGRWATSYLLAGRRRALLLHAVSVHQVAGVESEDLGVVEHHRRPGVAARVIGVHTFLVLRRTVTASVFSAVLSFTV